MVVTGHGWPYSTCTPGLDGYMRLGGGTVLLGTNVKIWETHLLLQYFEFSQHLQYVLSASVSCNRAKANKIKTAVVHYAAQMFNAPPRLGRCPTTGAEWRVPPNSDCLTKRSCYSSFYHALPSGSKAIGVREFIAVLVNTAHMVAQLRNPIEGRERAMTWHLRIGSHSPESRAKLGDQQTLMDKNSWGEILAVPGVCFRPLPASCVWHLIGQFGRLERPVAEEIAQSSQCASTSAAKITSSRWSSVVWSGSLSWGCWQWLALCWSKENKMHATSTWSDSKVTADLGLRYLPKDVHLYFWEHHFRQGLVPLAYRQCM